MQFADYAAVLAVWIVAIATPGPDVVLILRESVQRGRPGAVAAATGVVTGVVVWLVLAMAGAHLLLEADPLVLGLLQLVGGSYLAYLGAGALRGARAMRRSAGPSTGTGDPPEPPQPGRAGAYRRGLLTNLSNPKALVFFGTVFSVLVPASTTTGERIGLSFLLSAVAASWFCGLAWLSSSARVSGLLGRSGAGFDAVAGIAFLLLAALAIATGVDTLGR